MNGAVALHGGGEFLAGDEPFLEALLVAAAARIGRTGPMRVAIVPTAAARGRPQQAAANGVAAFERVAADGGRELEAAAVEVIDPDSAADPDLAAVLAAADVIHFPGGDPDLIPTVMPGSAAWAAISGAHASGAVLAGASAGAMALGSWTWTPAGGMAGLMVVRGFAVIPHVRPETWAATIDRFAAWAPEGLGALGLAEQTGVIGRPVEGAETMLWRVVGPGEVRWLAAPGAETVVARSSDTIATPVIPL